MAKWAGLLGSETIPNLKEIQDLLVSSSSFLFLGFERFLSVIQPNCIAPLNLTDCHLGMLFDLMETNESYVRQSNYDTYKRCVLIFLLFNKNTHD